MYYISIFDCLIAAVRVLSALIVLPQPNIFDLLLILILELWDKNMQGITIS